jgi:hypothetical protein
MASGKHAKADRESEIAPTGDDAEAPGTESEVPAMTHPEEMRTTIEIDIAGRVRFRATARATPAGLVSVALLLAAIMVPLAWANRGHAPARRRP